MNKKKLNLLALHAISLAKSKREVALKLTDEEAEYFLELLDETDITWATGDKPSKYSYYTEGSDRLLWITPNRRGSTKHLILVYTPKGFKHSDKLLRPSDMKEPSNFRRYI